MSMPGREHHHSPEQLVSTSRSLFDWEKDKQTPPYGDGPNRLPVINGIWKTSPRPSTHLFTIGADNDAAKKLIREEIDIAEIRQRQLEEVRRTRKGYNTVPEYKPVENLRTGSRPQYHGSISVVVLPSESKRARLESTTKRPKKKKGKKQKGKNKGKNKNKAMEAVAKPEGRVTNRWRSNPNSVLQRESRPYKPSSLSSRPSADLWLGDQNAAHYDDSCYEILRGKKIPMMAPPLPNAFVYKYDQRKHYSNPDSYYLLAHYRCRHGYKLRNAKDNKLYCKSGQWVGETPLCEG